MMSWLISILVLGVLVFVHELGHFLVARWLGVRVERFAIGFGPKLLGWRWGEVEYCLRLFPLGGYVKMVGEQPGEQVNEPGSFSGKPKWVRALIVFAGPAVNYLTSTIALTIVLIVGYPELLPSVGRLVDGMPAQAAGLQTGDRILAANGEPIKTWDELTKLVHHSADKTLRLDIERAGWRLTVPVTPASKEITDPFGRRVSVGLMGIAPGGAFDTYRVPPREAIGKTFAKQGEWASQIGMSLWSLFRGRASFKESFTGPIGILYMTSEAARMGAGPLLYLVSIFSLSLAIFNLFPIPILDGGHLAFLLIEHLRGVPVSLRTQEHAAKVSFALLLVLLFAVCANDISRFGLMDKLVGLWRRG